MRIVFIGCVAFSQHCLEVLIHHKANIVGILTLPPTKTHFNSDYADLHPIAQKHQIPLYHIQKASAPSTIKLLQKLRPDVIFVFGFSQLIPTAILNIPPLGCVGTHPALLPQHRGRHPLIWALVKDLSQSGLTFFFLDEGADSGDILWQKTFPITDQDDAASLYQKMKNLATNAIPEFLPQLQSGNPPRIPQDHQKATYWRKRSKEDGEINWSKSNRMAYNLIRALTRPYVGAHTYNKQTEIKIWHSRQTHQKSSENPGTIVAKTPDGLLVQTGDNLIEVLEWEGGDLFPGLILGREKT